jgi:hypothetical protein
MLGNSNPGVTSQDSTQLLPNTIAVPQVPVLTQRAASAPLEGSGRSTTTVLVAAVVIIALGFGVAIGGWLL